MEWEVTWGGDPEDILVVTSGVVTVEGLRAMGEVVLLDARYQPGMLALLDHTLLDWSGITSSEIRRRAVDLPDIRTRIGTTRIASVVATTVAFGLLRMLQIISNDALDNAIFYTRDDARAWLREEQGRSTVGTRPL